MKALEVRRGVADPDPTARPPRWLLALLALATVFTFATFALHAGAAGELPAAGEYAVDPAGSAVGFSITEFLINTVSGKFTRFGGHVTVGSSLETSKIEATVDVDSIDTGVHMRDGKLVSPEYFDAGRFPKMTFASTQIWGRADNFGIKGNLTIKGVTKEVVFTARIQDGGVVVAETKIDRTDFGITSGGTIKNEVRLRLQIRIARAP
jgi:polyisoprenoid-binding protein YceI